MSLFVYFVFHQESERACLYCLLRNTPPNGADSANAVPRQLRTTKKVPKILELISQLKPVRETSGAEGHFIGTCERRLCLRHRHSPSKGAAKRIKSTGRNLILWIEKLIERLLIQSGKFVRDLSHGSVACVSDSGDVRSFVVTQDRRERSR